MKKSTIFISKGKVILAAVAKKCSKILEKEKQIVDWAQRKQNDGDKMNIWNSTGILFSL